MHHDPPSRGEEERAPPCSEVERLIALLRHVDQLLAADEEVLEIRGSLNDLAVTARSVLATGAGASWQHILLLERLQAFRLSAGRGADTLDRRKLHGFIAEWLSDALWERWTTSSCALDAAHHNI